MNKNTLITSIVTLVIGIGIGFYGAQMLFRPSGLTRGMMGGDYLTGNGGTRASMMGNTGFINGIIKAKDAGSITIDTRDGSSHVILVTPNTSVSKSVSGVESDVTIGSTVMISGTPNSDGSISATFIQLRPQSTPNTGSASKAPTQ